VVEDIAQVGGHWAGGDDGVGSGLDFDGAVAAAGRTNFLVSAAPEVDNPALFVMKR
jgi:hypothetical protein